MEYLTPALTDINNKHFQFKRIIYFVGQINYFEINLNGKCFTKHADTEQIQFNFFRLSKTC